MLYQSPVSTNHCSRLGQLRALRLVAIAGEAAPHQATGLTDFARLPSEFLGKRTGVHGMFQRLLAEFVSLGGKVVQLCGSIVCALWHGGFLSGAVSQRERSFRASRDFSITFLVIAAFVQRGDSRQA